jgi:hypothetical protein
MSKPPAAAALFEDSDEERERKERERKAAQKLYKLNPPRLVPLILDDEEHGSDNNGQTVLAVHTYEDTSVYAGEPRSVCARACRCG